MGLQKVMSRSVLRERRLSELDMGDGTPAVTGIAIVATITTNDQHQGTVDLVIGATALPAATITGGSMTITNLAQ